MSKVKVTRSSGNVFVDLGFDPEEAMILAMRADLMVRLHAFFVKNKWTQQQAAAQWKISQSRVSDLIRGKWEKFSLDMLLILAARAGLHPEIKLTKAA